MAVWLARPPASVAKPSTRADRARPPRSARGPGPGSGREPAARPGTTWAARRSAGRGSAPRCRARRRRGPPGSESLSRSRRAAWASSTSMTACSAEICSRSIRPGRRRGGWGRRSCGHVPPGCRHTAVPAGLGLPPRPARPRVRRHRARDRAVPARRSTASAAILRGGSRMPRGSSTSDRPDRDSRADGDAPQNLHGRRHAASGRRLKFEVPGGGMPAFL